jgi:hypothetical protein
LVSYVRRHHPGASGKYSLVKIAWLRLTRFL